MGVGRRGKCVKLEMGDFGVSGGFESVVEEIFAPYQEEGQWFSPFDDGADILRDYLGRAFHVDLAGIQKNNGVVCVFFDPFILLVVPFLYMC